MDDDWDLQAIVRECCNTNTTTGAATISTTTTAAAASTSAGGDSFGQLYSTFRQDCNFSVDSNNTDLFEPRRDNFIDKNHPFFPNSQILISPQSLPISPLSVLGGIKNLISEQQQEQRITTQLVIPQQSQIRQKQQTFSGANGLKVSSRSKRRKNNFKRICHVPAENLSSDMWSWRKYGQKPIKGSPYPRGYYKCSTLKGCPARKQVERHRSDPGMLIITYTAEHNHPAPTHRSSLAGITRQKDAAASEPPCSSEFSPSDSLSQPPEKMESGQEDLPEEEDDGLSVPHDTELDDDFFAGLENFSTSENFPANLLAKDEPVDLMRKSPWK